MIDQNEECLSYFEETKVAGSVAKMAQNEVINLSRVFETSNNILTQRRDNYINQKFASKYKTNDEIRVLF
jgi:hypothetical protein